MRLDAPAAKITTPVCPTIDATLLASMLGRL
jgi:hypothetical protein